MSTVRWMPATANQETARGDLSHHCPAPAGCSGDVDLYVDLELELELSVDIPAA